MNPNYFPILIALGLFLGMLVLLEVGRRIGARHLGRHGEAAPAGLGAVQGAIFGLMGLVLAFTFSGAAARFDTRRALIVDEANAIRTAWLRLDLLPAEAQPALRESFRRYVDARLDVYRRLPDFDAALAALTQVAALQKEIWSAAAAATRERPPAAGLLLPALNQMIDVTTRQTMASRMHPPAIIFIMLGALALTGSLLAGYGMAAAKARNWFHILAFVAIMAVTIYVIIDLELPRLGLIRVDDFDQILVELRQGMEE